jgi:ankyrin repeat protein
MSTQNNLIITFINDLDGMKNLNIDYKSVQIDGHSLLHWVSAQGNSDVLMFLISKGCPVNVRTVSGYTILHEACAFGNTSNINAILYDKENRSMFFDVSHNGRTILHEACKYNQCNVLQYLSCHFNDEFNKLINIKDNYGKKAYEYITNENVMNIAYNIGLRTFDE